MATNNSWNSNNPVEVAKGGTGNTTFTAYSVVCTGTTATGSFQNVSGLGSAGQVLTSNGAGALPSWQAGGGGGSGALVLIDTQTASASSSVTFTTGISATYNNYRLSITNFTDSGASGTTALLLQISTNGGSTWISTNYAGGGTGMVLLNSITSTVVINGYAHIYNVTSGTQYVMLSSEIITNGVTLDSGSASTPSNNGADAYLTASTTVNAFRILTDDSSTFDGVFSLYGYTD